MRALKFITGHVIYNPAYTFKFQLKTTGDQLKHSLKYYLFLVTNDIRMSIDMNLHGVAYLTCAKSSASIPYFLIQGLLLSGHIMDFDFLHFVFFQVQYIHTLLMEILCRKITQKFPNIFVLKYTNSLVNTTFGSWKKSY